jgi:hypothetical protein
MSKPRGPGVIRANVVLVRHAGHSGRMMIMMLRLGSDGSVSELSVIGICRVRAVMEPASNFRNSAAVPFCSHSKLIDLSLANYDTRGFKLGQLLEERASQ